MRWTGIRNSALVTAIAVCGCNTSKPFIAVGPSPSTANPVQTPAATDSLPVATSALGTIASVPGVTPKPKPFIAVPKPPPLLAVQPSTLLLEHAVPESPVPLSDYAKQPIHWLHDFDLRAGMSAAQVQKAFGPPAQLADNEDPWFVYRLTLRRELWLHFVGPGQEHLDAADVVRPAEDGYTRYRVFSADDSTKTTLHTDD